MVDLYRTVIEWMINQDQFVLVIHGGAGTVHRDNSTSEQLEAFRQGLRSALLAGYQVLRSGGEAMDAAVAAVTVLEDCPLFNAGKGAVFNIDGKNELEASIMLSKPPLSHPEISPTRRGLAVTLLTKIKNPGKLARALYLSPDKCPHAFLSGSNAEKLAESLGEELVDPSYFFTEHRWEEHMRGSGLPRPTTISTDSKHALDPYPTGTVGAVALDAKGCIAVVTSTGGGTNKLVGRIGDTPIFGAGFWAEEWRGGDGSTQAVGISGTGDGDYFLRQATASTVGHRVKFLSEPLNQAAEKAIQALSDDSGLGGVIALDSSGHVVMSMNSPTMARGLIKQDGVAKTALFSDDILS